GELNISDNPDITDPYSMIKVLITDYINIKMDAIDSQTYEKIMSVDNGYRYFSNLIVNVDYDISKHNDYIDMTELPLIKKQIIKKLPNLYDYEPINCHLSKNGYTAYVDDYTKGFAEIKFYEITFRFNFN
nr:hypothetical protein [Lachnospiraceae bacterium]